LVGSLGWDLSPQKHPKLAILPKADASVTVFGFQKGNLGALKKRTTIKWQECLTHSVEQVSPAGGGQQYQCKD
jgi:hypothetical protein